MSEKMEAVATSEAPAALGAYSQAVKANGFVFVSGQLGIDPATGELAELIRWMNVKLAPCISIHGVLVDVYGVGVLIMGESGVGRILCP